MDSARHTSIVIPNTFTSSWESNRDKVVTTPSTLQAVLYILGILNRNTIFFPRKVHCHLFSSQARFWSSAALYDRLIAALISFSPCAMCNVSP